MYARSDPPNLRWITRVHWVAWLAYRVLGIADMLVWTWNLSRLKPFLCFYISSLCTYRKSTMHRTCERKNRPTVSGARMLFSSRAVLPYFVSSDAGSFQAAWNKLRVLYSTWNISTNSIYSASFHQIILTFAWSEKHLRFLVFGGVLVLRLIVKLNLMQAREQYTPSLRGVTTYGNVYQSISHTEESLPK